MEAVKVKVIKSVFVEQTGLKYKAGQEVSVPENVAKRQIAVGNMEAVPGVKAKKGN